MNRDPMADGILDQAELNRALGEMLWLKLASMTVNPWWNAAASEPAGNEYRERALVWETNRMDLTRALFQVVFHGADPAADLLTRALKFVGVVS